MSVMRGWGGETRGTALVIALVVAGCVAAPCRAGAQEQTDVVRGRVVDDSARALVATVIVTRGPDRLVERTTSDSAGRFEVRFTPGTGDYLVYASAPGFKASRKRVQRTGTERTLVADLALARDVAVLATVQVTASRASRPAPGVSPLAPETGTTERWNEGVSGQLPPAIAGDLSAITLGMANLTSGTSGPTVLGTATEANLTTLNGVTSPLARLPRAANAQTRVTTTTYDPARGGFSGANIDVRLPAGNRSLQERRAQVTVAPSPFASRSGVGQGLGAASVLSGSVGADGELVRRALTYNVALEVSRASRDVPTLLRADPAALSAQGVPGDSIRRLVGILATAMPVALEAGMRTPRRDLELGWLARLDDTRDSLKLRSLSTYFSRADELATGGTLPLFALTAGMRTRTAGGLQFVEGGYVGRDHLVLTETRAALALDDIRTRPGYAQPVASVLLRGAGTATDGSTPILLGSSVSDRTDRTWSADLANDTQWYRDGRRHRFKLSAWTRLEGESQGAERPSPGVFQFASLGALETGLPSRYTRALATGPRSAQVGSLALAASHQFAPTRFLSVLYGLRLEGTATGQHAGSALLDSAFGIATGIPGVRWHASPRLGFTYVTNRDRDNTAGQSITAVGRYVRQPTGVLRGGIGEFRSQLRPATLTRATSTSTERILDCIGAEAPSPDWAAFVDDPASLPQECRGATSGATSQTPYLRALDGSYDVARSWRASLDWTTNVSDVALRVSGLASYDLHQPGVRDPNFAGMQAFALANDRGRPVYVPTSAWDPASGMVNGSGSRLQPSLGMVDLLTSDLRGYGGQLNVTVAPDLYRFRRASGLYTSLSYSLQRATRELRGFDGGAFGDPRQRDWAPSSYDARHVVVLTAGVSSQRLGTFTMFARAQSGLPFTPLVQGDVNGDGRFGDAAVLDGSSVADTSLSRQLALLADGGAGAARSCIAALLAGPVGQNGCRGGWTRTLNAQWRPPVPTRWRRRVTPNVYIQNILGGVDQALHGTNGLRGWGQEGNVDPVLLLPRRFDPTAREIHYDVNPRFGQRLPSRTQQPFGIVLDVAVDWSVDFDLQQLRRATEPVRTTAGWRRRDAAGYTAAYLSRTSSIFKLLLEESDSLFLAPQQIAQLRVADSAYGIRVRAVYEPLGERLALAGETVGDAELEEVRIAQRAYWGVFWEQPEIAAALLTPGQRALMPLLQSMLSVPTGDRQFSQVQFGRPVLDAAADARWRARFR